MAKRKIHNVNTNGLDKNPQNINRNGRPKKNYTIHIEKIKAKGYSAPTKSEYFEMIGLLFVMSENDLKEFAEDKENPYWVRLLIIDLNNKLIRSRLMSDYRDWMFGKSDQRIEILNRNIEIEIEPDPEL